MLKGLLTAPVSRIVLLWAPCAPQPWFKQPEWVIVWVTGVYTIFAGMTLIAIAAQAYLMRRQDEISRESVEVARDSAKAALLNAQAVINSERPWIFTSARVKGQDLRHAFISFTATNRGRTPAEVTAISGSFTFADPDAMDWTPKYPMAAYELAHKQYLTTDGHMAISDINGFDCSIFGNERWDEVNAEGKRLVFYGHIVYRDLITREEHETRYCYWLSPLQGVGLIVGGPPEWNKHT